jgi:hypothetical protein
MRPRSFLSGTADERDLTQADRIDGNRVRLGMPAQQAMEQRETA